MLIASQIEIMLAAVPLPSARTLVLPAMLGFLLLVKWFYWQKKHSPLPRGRQFLALFPKYSFRVPMTADASANQIVAGLTACGCVLLKETSTALVFRRGTIFAMVPSSSRMIVEVPLPVTKSMEVRMGYSIINSALFDFGQLWKMCNKLSDELSDHLSQAASTSPDDFHSIDDAAYVESTNPYQAPRY